MINKVGRRLFYDKATGNLLVNTGEKLGAVVQTTVEQDIASYKVLSERERESFGVIDLPFGRRSQDFIEAVDARVNVDLLETLPTDRQADAIEFAYPDPDQPDAAPVYQKSLSESMNEQMDYLVDVDFRLSMVELGLL
ncbi:hypothetical protein [Pseudobacillus wudalianchiensis]|uniref:Uncharacterized protein n=1 Tax=Pseudobacillus wudalianchiensis TaxID=1743143 RepID=A0A1B9ATS6_9BACI|nr:hypothetical protein [Bacillus wudalianchiensis]OCA87277.1 hypothetical protein A8F95_08495 [Bacillus wudalianchiensis]